MNQQTIPVFPIRLNEVDRASETLIAAFKDDPFMDWAVPLDMAHHKRCQTVATWVRYCVRYGIALRTENFEAVALRKKPNDKGISFFRALRSGMLKMPRLMGKAYYDRLMLMDELTEEEIKRQMDNQPYLYCWMLGSLPEARGQGFAKALVKHTRALYDGVYPNYLITSSESARSYHKHNGFKELTIKHAPNCPLDIIHMRRDQK